MRAQHAATKAGESREIRDAIAALKRSRLSDVIRSGAVRAMVEAYVHASDIVGAELVFDPREPSTRRLLDLVGERIKDIEETTRERVEHYVTVGTNEGWGPAEIGRLIREDPSGAFSAARAEVIARTETGYVFNRANLDGYRVSKRVQQVLVYDGEDCGWEDHDDPDKAAGTVRDLDDAEDHELSHPNCVRSFAAVVDLE